VTDPVSRPTDTRAFRITVGGLEVLGVLGQGGMGRVYKARQTRLNRLVALKVLDPQLALDPENVERFLREARSAGKLRHKNIVALHDMGTCPESRLHYISMEYVDGGSLADELQRAGHLSERRALEIVHGVAQALGCAEEQKIIHRDVKPDNILLTRDGQPKLADLGLAKRQDSNSLTNAGMILGSAHYVAPEYVLGLPDMDIRADIYSLGVTLWLCLVGRLPYEGASFYEIAEKHISRDIPAPSAFNSELSPAIDTLALGMCARDRTERYRSAKALVADIERALAGEPPLGPAKAGGEVPANPAAVVAAAALDALEAPAPTATPAGILEVLVEQGGVVLGVYELEVPSASIGRSPSCEVHVPVKFVSRNHAELRVDGSELTLIPLSTTNETAVDGQVVLEPVKIAPGNVVTLSGEVDLHVSWKDRGGSSSEEATMPQVNLDLGEDTDPALGSDVGGVASELPADYAGYAADALADAVAPLEPGADENLLSATVDQSVDEGRATELAALSYMRAGQGARTAVLRGFQIGSGAECDLVLGAGAPRKVALVVRCLDGYQVWNVAHEPDHVQVNGRPVTDQAPLRFGDMLAVCGETLTFEEA
jgi:pSer/pThr/pTyr-binding forkhead associated (FHA) protein/tRNA A-37 threonylcarbamoyl transferase component Bud32